MIEWIELAYVELKKKMTVLQLKGDSEEEKLYRFVTSKKRLGVCLQEIESPEAEILREHKK